MSLISVCWTFFKSRGLWDKFDLDFILGKRDQLLKFIGKFQYLGMEFLNQEFFMENCSINVEFLDNKTGEITAGHIFDLLQKLKILFSKLGLLLYLLLAIKF